ncbi:MAG: hypothetical protein GPW19_04100 [Euryarchaeota archaeon]|nr:hypothetical protein [Euryarchaeota archaeon]
MKPCNYAWNLGALAFGRNIKMHIYRYQDENIDKDSLEIVGSIEHTSGSSQVMYNIPKIGKELTLDLIGFLSIPNLHIIAEIKFIRYSRKFTFWLCFKEEMHRGLY